jgi:hypothetical protein
MLGWIAGTSAPAAKSSVPAMMGARDPMRSFSRPTATASSIGSKP